MEKTKLCKTKLLCPIFTTSAQDIGLLLLRVFAGAMLLRHGLEKISNFETLSSAFPDPIGLGSKLSFILISATETIGSIFIMVGLLTRPAALAITFGMGVAAFVVHHPFTVTTSELPLMYMGIAVFFMVAGAGKYSIDETIRRKVCLL